MAADERNRPARSGPRLPKGKKQMLVILHQDVIKNVKMAALDDGIAMSHAVEEAIKNWLLARKGKRPPK